MMGGLSEKVIREQNWEVVSVAEGLPAHPREVNNPYKDPILVKTS